MNDDDISLVEFIRIVWRGWPTIAAAVGIGLTLAITIGLLSEPMYRAQVAIVEAEATTNRAGGLASALGSIGGLAGLAGIDLSRMSGQASPGPVIIRSRSLLERYIAENELLPVLYADEYSSQQPWQGANLLRRDHLTFEPSRDDPSVMVLTVEWSDPEVAADWANGLVRLANTIAREQDIAEANSSIDYLNRQLEQTSVVELRQSLFSLVEMKLQTLMLANAREEYAYRVVDAAYAPNNPVWPNWIILLPLGVVLGGFIGILAVFVGRLAAAVRATD